MSLPTGLDGAYRALMNHGADWRVLERVTTLVWLRVLTDPSAPLIGGHDSRRILDPSLTWAEAVTFEPGLLDVLFGRLNDVMGEPLLSADWRDEIPPPDVARALLEVGRWALPAGDPLGHASQLLASSSSKQARGAFYTPYPVSLMMAMMVTPQPGESVCDPCCGSGGMLLAALEACRSAHGPDAVLEVFGVDIDAAAVRLCKLNLALAGIAPNPRIWNGNSLTDAPPALVTAFVEHQEQLSLLEGA